MDEIPRAEVAFSTKLHSTHPDMIPGNTNLIVEGLSPAAAVDQCVPLACMAKVALFAAANRSAIRIWPPLKFW